MNNIDNKLNMFVDILILFLGFFKYKVQKNYGN